MEIVLKMALYVHIVAGFTALTTGLVPMFAKKGGKAHVFWGNVFYWAMFLVALTALMRFKMEFRLIFLTGIAVFSFYNTFTGARLVRMKKNLQPEFVDWFGAILTMVSAFAMMAFAVLAYQKGVAFYVILFTIFGVFSLLLATEDLRVFLGKKVVNNTGAVQTRYWFQNHISRMGGAYIATVTAFLVVNNPPYIPSLLVWIAPGVIGGMIIGRTRKYYMEKAKSRL
ncbi:MULTISPECIES: DUF2306 domain-containing protein [unclassified Arcicella]|uniref:DUF2306 domain-containing protein n=1 Tax=unclassified Arcicella TaxID=2644986 RepID=UPI0028647366|nr:MULTISPECIES: DUF2306 domain-containing protein [unclassified Arcicella]MDR6563600.1 putative membrane protein [Arcicella sp. BE51]MDR6814262.1 putative membrane protein [Arcicella sp. BE140]MDR6825499.1 putative membrane protein [Arcicella sp. BE139]